MKQKDRPDITDDRPKGVLFGEVGSTGRADARRAAEVARADWLQWRPAA
jgi:hypothetical protein